MSTTKLSPNWIQDFMAREEKRVKRHRRDFEEIAKLERKTVAQVEKDLCKRDGQC